MKRANPKILYICSSWPCDKAFGGQLRALQIGRALQKIGDVTVSVVSWDDPQPDVVERTQKVFAVQPPVKVLARPNRGIIDRTRWALDTHFLNVHGCVADPSDRQRLLAEIDKFDLVWVLNSRTPNILDQWRWPHSVLDIDDVPSTYLRTIWQNGASLKDKLKAGVMMKLFKRREQLWTQRFSAISVCSENDRQYLGDGDRIHVIPNGFERPAAEPVPRPVDPPRIGFIGLYSYPPNLEGMRWFIDKCWPAIKARVPNAVLRVAGKDSDGPMKPVGPDVQPLGYVPDSAAEIATWSATIIPVLHGAGTRVKLADAFSRKCPVVSTKLGAFGYEVESGRDILLADTALEFSDACVSLLQNRSKAVALAESAWRAFLEKWTWDAIAPRVWAAAESSLQLGKRNKA
jgi:glycosyltransferase involved in cell wall biosynthesis